MDFFDGKVIISISDFDNLRSKAKKYDEEIRASALIKKDYNDCNVQRLHYMDYFLAACKEINQLTGENENDISSRIISEISNNGCEHGNARLATPKDFKDFQNKFMDK